MDTQEGSYSGVCPQTPYRAFWGYLVNLSVELLLGIGLAVTVPLLGVVAGCMFVMKSELKTLSESVKSFQSFFDDIKKSLDHNRNEHTQLMAVSNALLKEVADSRQDMFERIALTEERLKGDD